VNLGLDLEVAKREASRCLSCANTKCVKPARSGEVKDFIELILKDDILGAAAKIREDNVLPAVTGRVCPQEDSAKEAASSGRSSSRWRSVTSSAMSPTTRPESARWAFPAGGQHG